MTLEPRGFVKNKIFVSLKLNRILIQKIPSILSELQKKSRDSRGSSVQTFSFTKIISLSVGIYKSETLAGIKVRQNELISSV